MKKPIVLLGLFALMTVPAAAGKDKPTLAERIDQIAKIDNDIARLEAFDELAASLRTSEKPSPVKEAKGPNPFAEKKEEPKVLLASSGSGAKTTAKFRVGAEGARILFRSPQGKLLQIYVYDSAGEFLNIAQTEESTTQVSHLHEAGVYYLDVIGLGKWAVKVVE